MNKKLLFVPAAIVAAGLMLAGCTAPDTDVAPAPTESVAPTENPAEALGLPAEVPLITENIIEDTFVESDTGWMVQFTGDIADVPERVLSAMEADGWEVGADDASKTYSGENDNYMVAFNTVPGGAEGAAYEVTISKK